MREQAALEKTKPLAAFVAAGTVAIEYNCSGRHRMFACCSPTLATNDINVEAA